MHCSLDERIADLSASDAQVWYHRGMACPILFEEVARNQPSATTSIDGTDTRRFAILQPRRRSFSVRVLYNAVSHFRFLQNGPKFSHGGVIYAGVRQAFVCSVFALGRYLCCLAFLSIAVYRDTPFRSLLVVKNVILHFGFMYICRPRGVFACTFCLA